MAGGLALSSGSVVTLGASASTQSPPVTVTGCVDLSGTLNVDVTYDPSRGTYTDSYPLIESTEGCLNGDFDHVEAIVSPPTCHTAETQRVNNILALVVRFDAETCLSTASTTAMALGQTLLVTFIGTVSYSY